MRIQLVRAIALALLTCSGCYPFGTNIGEFHFGHDCSALNLRPIRADSSGVDERVVLTHAIFVDARGHALQPHTDACASVADKQEYGTYLGHMLDSIRARGARDSTPPRLLIRIHSGLNTLNGSLDATVAMNAEISRDAQAGYYPLFVNWESGLISAYGEHMAVLARGEQVPKPWLYPRAILGSPVVLATDLVTGLVHLPLNIPKQLGLIDVRFWYNDLPELSAVRQTPAQAMAVDHRPPVDTVGTSSSKLGSLAPSELALFHAYQRTQRGAGAVSDTAASRSAAQGAAHDRAIAVSRFAYHRSLFNTAKDVFWDVALTVIPMRCIRLRPSASCYNAAHPSTFAGKARDIVSWLSPKLASTAILDGLGTPSWSSMRRRAALMIRPNDSWDNTDALPTGYRAPAGALAVFLDSIATLGPRYKITIVGHSMGAIVATQIVRHRDTLPIDNIVLMASAASVREVSDAVIPYMQSPIGQHTQLYNLTLHPWADSRESEFFGVAPFGSLLAWIDAFFGTTETPQDKMAGVYGNLIQTNVVFPDDLRGRTHFKAFGVNSHKGCGPSDLPVAHGDFNEPAVPYWREKFWHPGPATCTDVLLPRR